MRSLLLAVITAPRNTPGGSKGGHAHNMTTRGLTATAATVARRNEGQAMAEYTLILGLVVVGLIAVYTSLGTTCIHLFQEVVDEAFGS
jgi:Flp pilus assembly pilin Flp